MMTCLAVRSALVACVLLVMGTMPPNAAALTLSFFNITGNNPLAALAGEAQLSVEVTAFASNQVQFQFFNIGTVASSIADIYFDDTSVLLPGGPATIINGSGVSFSQGAAPPNLPGGNTVSPAFSVTTGFDYDSDRPTLDNGVGLGETLSIILFLQTGKTFADVESDLANGNLRLGMHVQGFALGGGSEAFINNPFRPDPPPPVVPEPSTLLLLGSGLGTIFGVARRRFRRQ
ncbi:MAG: PEP-CTERM sorting domain-containing protein [bacterium]